MTATTATLQDEVRSLSVKLRMIAMGPGSIDTESATAARAFYEHWHTINEDCIAGGHEDSGGDLSFVQGELRALLAHFPADKTVISVLEVFPLSIEASFVFGNYIDKLDKVARSKPVAAA